MTNANAKQSHMRNDASHEPQSPALSQTTKKPSRLAKTLLALCLLVSTQLAWGQDPITVTHSTSGTVGTYTDLGAAIRACTITIGTYTITVSEDAELSTIGKIPYAYTTINLVSSVANTQRTITITKPDVYINVNGGNLTMTDIVLHGNDITNTSNAITPNGSGGVTCYMLIQTYSPGNLTMDNCTVRNGKSGGIYFNGNSLSITNSRIENNEAAQGGGLYIEGKTGTCKLTNTTISNNTSETNGGGIYCKVDLECDGATISYNTSETNGGGIYQANGELLCKNNTSISNNQAKYSGGGIYNQGSLTCTGTEDAKITISGNRSRKYGGGGVYTTGTTSFTHTIVTNNRVETDPATQTPYSNELFAGGGIYYYDDATLSLTNSEVSDNVCIAHKYPGITANYVGAPWVYGGGIYVGNGDVTISNSMVNNNFAMGQGGGIYQNAGTLTIEDGSEVNENQTTYQTYTPDPESGDPFRRYGNLHGGGILFNGTTLSIDRSRINENGSTEYKGSAAGVGVAVEQGTATISNCFISLNKGRVSNGSLGGGGVYVRENATLTMTNTEVTDNKFETDSGDSNEFSHGAGLFLSGAATLTNCTITGNTGNNTDGGGILCNASGKSVTIDNCTIANNCVGDLPGDPEYGNGGGLYLHTGTVNITNSFFGLEGEGNTASRHGGGIYIDNNAIAILKGGNTIQYNTASIQGGGIYIKKGSPSYATAQLQGSDNIIQNNTATDKAGGVYKDGSLKVEGTPKITNNTAGTAKAVVEENVYIPVNSADDQTILITGELACDSKIGVTKTKKWSGAPEYGDINGDGTVNASDNGDHSYNDDDNFNEVRTAIAKVSPTNTSESWANDAFKRDVFFDDKKNYGVWSFNYSNSNDDTKAYSDQCDYFIETWRCYASNASTDVATSEGNVTQVKTAAGLAYLSNHVNGLNGMTANTYSGQWIDQTADIDLTGHYWEPIGYSTGDECGLSNTFQGNYDGRGHIITNATSILPVTDMGLFGTVENGTVMRTFNLAHDFTLTSTESPGMGGIAGMMNATAAALMDGCEAAGTLTRYAPSAKGNRPYATHTIGGLVGLASANEAPAPGGGGNAKDGATGGTLEVRNSFATTTINGNDSSIAGGLVGSLDCQNGSAKLANSYSVPTITGGTNTGSLVGMANSSTITNCYTQNQALNLIGATDRTITTENLFKPEGALKQESYTETYTPTIGADYLGYMRADNCIANTTTPLFARLNTWVNTQNGGNDVAGAYNHWARPALAYYGEKNVNTDANRFDTIIKPINADLPVLRLCESSKRDVGTTDGLTHATKGTDATLKYYQGGFRAVGTYGGPGTVLQYGGPDRDGNGNEIVGALTRAPKDANPSYSDHLFIYGDIVDAIASHTRTQDKVSLYQHAAVLQPTNLGTVYVGVEVNKGNGNGVSFTANINGLDGQTLTRNWHLMSSPLRGGSYIGFDYKYTNYGGNYTCDTEEPTYSTLNTGDNPTNEYWNNPWQNGGTAEAGAQGGMEFHWLNGGVGGNNRYWMNGWVNSQEVDGSNYPRKKQTQDYSNNNPGSATLATSSYYWNDGYLPSNITLHPQYHGTIEGTDEYQKYPYGMDFYSWFEEEQHFINFKRNGTDHWHSDTDENGWHQHLDYKYYTWDGYDWYAPTNKNETYFIPGKGYIMSIAEMTLLQAKGALNDGSVQAKLTHTEKPNIPNIEPGYNLVGNPYHAYYTLGELTNISVLDKNVFKAYVPNSSTGADVAHPYQHPHQGFFMKVDEEDSHTFVINNVVSRHQAGWYSDNGFKVGNTYQGFRGTTDDTRPAYPLVNLYLSSAKGCADVCVVEFNRPEWGGGEKLKSLYFGNGLLYAKHDDKSYAALFATEETRRVPLQFVSKDEEGDTYTLSWTTANADFEKLILVDNMTGVQYDMLADTSYSFSGKKGDYWSRFYITFEVTGVDEQEEADDDASSGAVSFAFFDGSQWVVTNTAATGATTLDLIDLQGRVLHHTTLGNEGQTRVSLPDVAKGMYLLRMTNQNGTQVQKIVVN